MIDDWWLMIDDWWLMIDDWWLIDWLIVQVPAGHETSNFNWISYLQQTKGQAASVNLFPVRDNTKHAFKVGSMSPAYLIDCLLNRLNNWIFDWLIDCLLHWFSFSIVSDNTKSFIDFDD